MNHSSKYIGLDFPRAWDKYLTGNHFTHRNSVTKYRVRDIRLSFTLVKYKFDIELPFLALEAVTSIYVLLLDIFDFWKPQTVNVQQTNLQLLLSCDLWEKDAVRSILQNIASEMYAKPSVTKYPFTQRKTRDIEQRPFVPKLPISNVGIALCHNMPKWDCTPRQHWPRGTTRMTSHIFASVYLFSCYTHCQWHHKEPWFYSFNIWSFLSKLQWNFGHGLISVATAWKYVTQRPNTRLFPVRINDDHEFRSTL